MTRPSLRQSLRRLWALDKFSYSLRVFIALSGSLILCWSQDQMHALIPLFLGVIASALAETDDSWQGRLTALLVTLCCFSAAALTVESVSYTHLRAHETDSYLVCRLLLEKTTLFYVRIQST